MGRKKKLSVETTSLNFLNMELLLNLLRHKINLYRNKQGQYSKKHLLQKINNQGPGHSLRSLQEGFYFTCIFHHDTQMKFLPIKLILCTWNMLSLSEVQRFYIHHSCLSYFYRAPGFPI